VNLEKNVLPEDSLEARFALLLSHGCSLGMMLDGVWLLLIGCNAATRHNFCIRLFGAFPMQVATTTTQISRGLLAVRPDMAKVLAVVALRKASLSSV
jgi:hypothetical protein